MSIGNFVKAVDPSLYNSYKMEVYKNGGSRNTSEPNLDKFRNKTNLPTSEQEEQKQNNFSIPSIDDLKEDHYAKIFITKRQIPKEKYKNIFFAQDFMSFVDELIPDHGKNLLKNDPRIVIPFYDKNKNLLGIQGRALLDSPIRYITIKTDENAIKLYGLDTVDINKKIYVVEGPFDSMFLNNSIAVMDSALYKIVTVLGENDYVFVYDNEPRNKEIVKHMNKTINMGHDICIWPQDVEEKDINDMIINSNRSAAVVQSIIDNNTYNNIRARLALDAWKKI